ncbi:hypothetical protein VTK73DRAFT_6824 [Phialemonium thermophilum]|uniref:Uncharacterized protein n=1 Tax=Phialemonium thermophilum TaxID=223376 RepID=A0ABR3Y771_9PEZI
MASPDVAAVPVNGLSALSRPDSPSSVLSSTKRKRDDSDDGSPAPTPAPDHGDGNKPTTDGALKQGNSKTLIRNFFEVLQRYDTKTSILKYPISGTATSDDHPSKRQKSEDSSSIGTIESKVSQDAYDTVEELISDITSVVKAHVDMTTQKDSLAGARVTHEMAVEFIKFKNKAYELYRRELSYPQLDPFQPDETQPDGNQSAHGPVSLMIYSNTSIGRRPLLTSLQRLPRDGKEGEKHPATVSEAALPPGVYVSHVQPPPAVDEKLARPPTLGELFPSPRNLPALQPHRSTKSNIKNNVLTFYHPELTSQSRFRSGTYFSQPLSVGQWLDYSNATPSSHIKTKQRERAQSLAGHKPSTTELEMSEMEALFRGAFSSFAPCKDDTAAVVPAGQLSQMYWQQWGRRNLQRMIEVEPAPELHERSTEPTMEVDEDIIQEAIESWDDAAVDPSLSQVLGEKSDEEKDVDDLLEEITNMIETLASYQRNRNLTLPTSQDRHSAEPPSGDMLRNGVTSAHQPGEEEVMAYEALKSQLALIIQTLPPFAVARINSDKLEELNVSMKMQVRSEDYSGVMDEDESAARLRQALLQASSAGPPRGSHRTPSMSANAPYANHHQFPGQFGLPNQSSVTQAVPSPHYPQTPVRAPSMYQRLGSTVPIQQPHQVQARPPPQQPYRTPGNYAAMPQQLPKPQTPYTHSTIPQYSASIPGQPRMTTNPGYQNMAPGTPNHRYQAGYATGYPPQQQMHPQQQQGQHHPQQRQFAPYMNGAAQMSPRTMSPQVPAQPPMYNQSPTPSQQHHQQIGRAPYGTPNQAIPPNMRNYGPGPGTPGVPPQVPQQMQQQMPQQLPQQMPQQGGGRNVGVTGYHTVMGDAQQQQVIEQARQQAQARQDAQSRTIGYGSKGPQGEIVGLAGIGLSGNVDIQKLAAARANYAGINNMSPSPKPAMPTSRSPMPGAVNGVGGPVALAPPPVPQPSASPVSGQGGSVSPGPSATPNPPAA